MQSISKKFVFSFKPSIFLSAVVTGGLVGMAYLPKEWEMLRLVFLICSVFCVGMIAAQHAAIWEPVEEKKETGDSPENQSKIVP